MKKQQPPLSTQPSQKRLYALLGIALVLIVFLTWGYMTRVCVFYYPLNFTIDPSVGDEATIDQ